MARHTGAQGYAENEQVRKGHGSTRTAKGYKRWTNAKGNVEKLVTMGSPSATAMHHTIWPEVEPSVEEYLQERLQAQAARSCFDYLPRVEARRV